MAKDKKSFILYCDFINVFEHLSDREAGILIKHLFKYVNDQDPKLESKTLKIAFEPIKQQLKRDLKDWEAEKARLRESGKKGGIKSGESRRNRSTRSTASKNEALEAVTVTVTDTVTVNERVVDAARFSNAEEIVLDNQIEFESICMRNRKKAVEAKELLRDYHLYLIKEEKYPLTRKQIFAGFEKWVRDEKKFVSSRPVLEQIKEAVAGMPLKKL